MKDSNTSCLRLGMAWRRNRPAMTPRCCGRWPDGKFGSGPGAFFRGRTSTIPATKVLWWRPRPSPCVATTDVRLTRFNQPLAANGIAFRPHHCRTQLVQHAERRLVAFDPEHLLELERGHTGVRDATRKAPQNHVQSDTLLFCIMMPAVSRVSRLQLRRRSLSGRPSNRNASPFHPQ